MRARIFRAVLRKEFLDTIRDRRALFAMIVVPVAVIPVLIFGLGAMMAISEESARAKVQPVAIVGGEHASELVARVNGETLLEVLPAGTEDVDSLIREGGLRAALVIAPGFADSVAAFSRTKPTAAVRYDKTEVASEEAADRLVRVVNAYFDETVRARVIAAGLDTSYIDPFAVKRENVAPKEKMGGFILSLVLPYLIVILAVTGAMYPAMDLTAGEKERGTMETLLSSPATRLEIAAGKATVVFLAALITSILATCSMAGTMAFGMTMLPAEEASEVAFAVSPTLVLAVLVLLLPTAALLSGALVAISLAARTYKEAQSYLTPLMLIVIIPAYVSFMRGFEPTLGWALVPIANVCLSMKQLLLGQPEWPFIALSFVSMFVYGSIAVWIAARQFERESVLFRE